MCGDERALARVVVKVLNTRRCDWPWPERIVTLDDIRIILGRLAVDEDEVTRWPRNVGQWVSILDALTDSGYVYLDSHAAQQPYGPLCRGCEREVRPVREPDPGQQGRVDLRVVTPHANSRERDWERRRVYGSVQAVLRT